MTGSRPYRICLSLFLLLAHALVFGQQSLTGSVADGRTQ